MKLSGLRNAALKLSRLALRQHQRLHARLDRPAPARPSRKPYQLRHRPSVAEQLIVHCNGNFAIGGSTQLIVDLIELSSDTYRHEVVVPHLPDPIPYEPVDLHAFALDRMEEFRSWLSERRPALVHIHYWSRAENRFDATGVWYATVLAICDDLGLAVVQNINVPTKPMQGRPVLRNVYVSQYVLDHFDDGEVPAEVIHPGSDFTHFARQVDPDTPDTIGMVYRLDGDKLNERSIEPFILVAKARPSTRCIIVGEGHFSLLYRERVSQEGLTDRFEFAGLVSYDELPALYERMGIFVAPVHNESFGQVSPFAMSMALPVAGYEIGALSEILGSRATLVAAGDERALAECLLALLAAPDKRRKIGAANRKRAHSLFSRDAMVEEYRRLYRSLFDLRADVNE